MYDRDLLIEVLTQVRNACRLVLQRFKPVRSVQDFTGSAAGMEKLDAICMQLIAIGESLKKVDTITEGNLLPKYTAIDWKKAKGMRDILSHHYFDVNAEAIFDVCANKMTLLERTIKQIIQELEK